MKNRFSLCLLVFCLLATLTVRAQINELPRSTPEGVNTGGWGLYIQSGSLATFGQLLLNRGVGEGKQLLPVFWVEQMTSRQIEAGDEDYGYRMGQCEYPGAIRLDGALAIISRFEGDNVLLNVAENFTSGDGVTIKRRL